MLETILSLDKMMIRFFESLEETQQMKNKSIKEEGFISNLTAERRIAAKVVDQEYDDHCENGEVESMISFLIQKKMIS